MTLQQLIKSYSWLSIKLTLEKLFPKQDNCMEDYKKMFEELQIMPIKQSNITIDVEWIHDDYDNTDYVNVSGYYTDPALRTNEYSNSMAIEFVAWDEWLGMEIDSKSILNFTELEIIAYCIDEMSFAGFEQEEIQSEMDKIRQSAEDYNNMTPEEKKQNTFTFDELKERLKNKEKDENSCAD